MLYLKVVPNKNIEPEASTKHREKRNVLTISHSGFASKQTKQKFVLFACAGFAVLLGLLASVFLPGSSARAVTPPDSCFIFSAGAITGYYNNEGNNPANPICPKAVDIPGTIGGVSVTSIGADAFRNKALTGVSIPSGVTLIGTQAFMQNQLTSLTIPSTVTSISIAAFAENRLTSLTVPSSVTNIGIRAFRLNQITDPVILGNPVGSNVFQENPINSISYSGGVHEVPDVALTPPDLCFNFTRINGTLTLYRLFDLSLMRTGTACMARDIIIPSVISGAAVTVLGPDSFSQQHLRSVTIPNTVISIGLGALERNVLLNLTIPSTIATVGVRAFRHNQLTDVNIQSNMTTIYNSLFSLNRLDRVDIPTTVTMLHSDAFFAQNPWGNNIDSSSYPDRYIYSTDPVVVQQVYDSIWYTRAYTDGYTNPRSFKDAATSESWSFGDRNMNGSLADSMGGHIINPASTVVRYHDRSGNSISPAVTITGIKTGRTPSDALGSDDYLHTYLAAESDIPAPLDPRVPLPAETSAMELGFSQYFRIGDTIAFSAKAITGYASPANQNVVLDEEDNVITFVYSPLITSVPFRNRVVIDGEATSAQPPAGVSVPTLSQSTLSITPGDCTTFESANLITSESIVTDSPSNNISLLGGVDFSLLCSDGGAANITLSLGTLVGDTSKLRVYKYSSAAQELIDISSLVTFSAQAVDNAPKTVISYIITDGGALDEDQTANGIIVDPIAIGYTGDISELTGVETLAETGTSLLYVVAVLVSVVALGGGSAKSVLTRL